MRDLVLSGSLHNSPADMRSYFADKNSPCSRIGVMDCSYEQNSQNIKPHLENQISLFKQSKNVIVVPFWKFTPPIAGLE